MTLLDVSGIVIASQYSRCPVVVLSLRISILVLPLTAMISCPFVPENDPTAASEMLVGGDNVRLSRCIVETCLWESTDTGKRGGQVDPV